MRTAVAKSKLAEVVEEVTTLSASQLDKLLPKIVKLRLEKRKLVLPERESELLKIISRGLTPEKRGRYQELRDKMHTETLTESEQVELLRLSDELEWPASAL